MKLRELDKLAHDFRRLAVEVDPAHYAAVAPGVHKLIAEARERSAVLNRVDL